MVQTGGITVKIPVKGTEELQMKMGKLSSDEPIKLASYKIKLDYVSELNLDLNIQELDLKISSCRKGDLKLNCKNLTFEAGSLSGLAISGKTENATFVSNGIADIEAYDLKIQDATFDNSSILKAKLYINGTIQGKSNGFFELRYKGNAISRIGSESHTRAMRYLYARDGLWRVHTKACGRLLQTPRSTTTPRTQHYLFGKFGYGSH